MSLEQVRVKAADITLCHVPIAVSNVCPDAGGKKGNIPEKLY